MDVQQWLIFVLKCENNITTACTIATKIFAEMVLFNVLGNSVYRLYILFPVLSCVLCLFMTKCIVKNFQVQKINANIYGTKNIVQSGQFLNILIYPKLKCGSL